MSTNAMPVRGSRITTLTRRAGAILERRLEPGEHVGIAAPVTRGRVITSLLIAVPGVILAGVISGRWNAAHLTVAGTTVYFAGFIAALTLGTSYGLRPRILVLTDRRLLLCRQSFWLARPTDRIDVDQRRDAVSTTWQTRRRFALKNFAGNIITIRLRAGASAAAAVKDWTSIPPVPAPPA